jgi:hypothetical protein
MMTSRANGWPLLYVFTTNGHPFEANQSFDRFGVFVRLKHGGDFAAAARDLAARGYGSPPARPNNPSKPQQSPPDSTGPAAADHADGRQGFEIIRDYFVARYQPGFKVRDSIFSGVERREVRRVEATGALPEELLIPLQAAVNVTRFPAENGEPGRVKTESLPAFFKRWSPTAWDALLKRLPDEDQADLGTPAAEMAAEVFRQLVREALLTPILMGQWLKQGEFQGEKMEKRPLAEWCRRFAGKGRFADIRELKIWSRTLSKENGELVIEVALRHELFSQIKADKRLIEMGPGKFNERVERYGVGKVGGQKVRPHGNWAVVLNPGFVADLLGSVDVEDVQDDSQTNVSQERD